MTKTKELLVYVAVDEGGHHVVAGNSDAVADYAAEDLPSSVRRFFCLKLTVPLPRMTVLTGTVPDEAGGEVKLTVQ